MYVGIQSHIRKRLISVIDGKLWVRRVYQIVCTNLRPLPDLLLVLLESQV